MKSRQRKKTQSKGRAIKTRRVDGPTIVLAIVVLILLLGVIFAGRLKSPGVRNNDQPLIVKRVEGQENQQKDSLPIELGQPETAKESKPETQEKEKPISGEEITARLFYTKFIDESRIATKSVLRKIPKSPSPMTMVINVLLEGPRANEINNNFISLIPKGSKLLGARVENNIAFLNFNEQFRFNTLGIDGYKAQVEQIVFTATEFPTVDKVQILIEGQKIDYLGGEGFWVGRPLGREDFD